MVSKGFHAVLSYIYEEKSLNKQLRQVAGTTISSLVLANLKTV